MPRPLLPALGVALVLALGGRPTPLGSAPAPAPAATPAATPVAPLGKRACRPDCRNRRCGEDGCGGTCGDCPAGQSCHRDRCVKRPKDPCAALRGTWVGTMSLNLIYTLRGTVWGTRHACFGRFHITYTSGARQGWADETFTLLFPAKRVYFRGTRILRSSPGSNYVLDNFSGTVDYRRGHFLGVFHDGRRTWGRVELKKR
jgi:hypothetical protein